MLPSLAHAQAQVSAQERSLAESLFQDGKQLLSEGKAAEACPKLAESQRIDPGAGTLTALALCHRAEGKTASAWSEFREVISLARRDGRKDREQVAQDNVSELEPKLSRLKVMVDPAAEAQAVQIRVDDLVYTQATFNQSLPVDPGVRRIRVTAAGKKPFETTVTVGQERDEKTVTIHALEDDPRATAAMSDRTPGSDKAGGGGGSPTLKYVGYGLAGLGVVGLGIGTVFGLSAISKNDDSNAVCPNASCGDQNAVKTNDDARTAATISSIAVIGGAAALVGGIVLILTSPSAKASVSTAIKPAPQKVGITGFGRSVVGISGQF